MEIQKELSVIEKKKIEEITQLIQDLRHEETRQDALFTLASIRRMFPKIATLIWYSIGTITVLIGEVIKVYPYLTSNALSKKGIEKVISVIQLLECLALNQETRSLILKANIPVFVFPFLKLEQKTVDCQYLRTSSSSFISCLLIDKNNQQSIDFLLRSEIICLCMISIKNGKSQTRLKCMFIIFKILQNNKGLQKCCKTGQKFSFLANYFNQLLHQITHGTSIDRRTFSYLIKCYLRLTDNKKACQGLKKCFPQHLKYLQNYFFENQEVQNDYTTLLERIKQ